MFFVLGLGVVLLLYGVLSRWRVWVKVVWSAAVLCCLAIALVIVAGPFWEIPSLRGGTGWWNASPGKEAILLTAMIAGMFLRVVWDAVEDYRRRKKGDRNPPVFDVWEFVSPAIVSLVVFQPVLSMGEQQPMSVKLALFSLQNGFFWNTIFAKLKGARR
jgi:hypothetical protein